MPVRLVESFETVLKWKQVYLDLFQGDSGGPAVWKGEGEHFFTQIGQFVFILALSKFSFLSQLPANILKAYINAV